MLIRQRSIVDAASQALRNSYSMRLTSDALNGTGLDRGDIIIMDTTPLSGCPLTMHGQIVHVYDQGRDLVGRYRPLYLVLEGRERTVSVQLSIDHEVRGVLMWSLKNGLEVRAILKEAA